MSIWKIYFISKKYARAEAKDNPKLENNNDEDSMTPSYNSSYNESPVAEVRNGTGKDAVNHEPTVSLSINKSAELQIKYEISDHVIAEDSNSIEVASETDWLREKEHQNNHLSVESAYHSHHNHFSDSHRHHHHPHHHHHHHNHHHHHHHSKFGSGPLKKLSAVTISSVKRFLQRRKNKHNSHAIRTLGVIMGLFTACWAPFFVLAVVSPLCGSACNIPGYLYSIFLWIGYVNSCFNPIVYARFNRQFRTPFREIICCRCSQLTQSIRHTDYIDQYGPDEEKHEGHSVGHGHTH
ncbi:HTR7 [Bugula neritina]|uniref:HTR7 n=1 Tax=Bugula neritina TaxID=10212 RepID=A0A7J7JE51_BUGNE|nr:HTR7 [Bugula neritina]